MFAAMTEEDKAATLGNNPRLGVRRIVCAPIPGSHDHKRWNAMRTVGCPFGDGVPVPVGDFLVTRTDGTTVRFHTTHGSKRVEVVDASIPDEFTGRPMDVDYYVSETGAAG